ncbi:MAG: hypothetical protein V7784_12410 [Oceanospirillaceae bacterium]
MFNAHGEFRISTKNHIVIIELIGPFNKEAVEQLNIEMEKLIDYLPSKWGQIVNFHQDSIFTPQAEQSMKLALFKRKSRGLSASAVLIGECYAKFVIQNQISRVYDEVGLNYLYMEDFTKAEEWIEQQISSN